MHLSQILAEMTCFQLGVHEDQPVRSSYYYCRHKTVTCQGFVYEEEAEAVK